jgi:hypothetical protein
MSTHRGWTIGSPLTRRALVGIGMGLSVLLLAGSTHTPPFRPVAGIDQAEAANILEGTAVTGNTITLKPGYSFQKRSANSVRVLGAGGKEVGDYSCTCSGSGGTCSVVQNPTSMTCSDGSCTGCKLVVTPKGSDKPTLLQR